MMTEAWMLWRRLEGGIGGRRCYRKRLVGTVRPLVWIPKAQCVVTMDGDTSQAQDDTIRALGIRVIRCLASEARDDMDGLVARVRAAVDGGDAPPTLIRDRRARGYRKSVDPNGWSTRGGNNDPLAGRR
jgi:hypothetical protein